MAIQFIGATSTSLDGNPQLPAGTQAGDLILIITQNYGGAPTPPSGWTQLGNPRDGFYTATVWYTFRGATAPSVSWLADSFADIVAYRGVTEIHAWAQSALQSAVAPSVNVTVPNAVLVCLYADEDEINPGPPAGMTKRSPEDTYNCIAELQLTSPGATGDRTFTSTSIPIGAWTVVLAEAPQGEQHSGGAPATVRTSAAGGGRPGFAYGSAGAITTSSTGQGAPGFRAGVPMGTARVDVSGAGIPGILAGSGTGVTATGAGDGRIDVSGGAAASIGASPAGRGALTVAAGSTPGGVEASAAGAGSPATGGGAAAVVEVAATGHGVSDSASGGSSAVVEVAATGGGIVRLRSDLNVIVGPSRISGAAAAPSRVAHAVGPSRTGNAVGPSRVGNTVGPSRVERGE